MLYLDHLARFSRCRQLVTPESHSKAGSHKPAESRPGTRVNISKAYAVRPCRECVLYRRCRSRERPAHLRSVQAKEVSSVPHKRSEQARAQCLHTPPNAHTNTMQYYSQCRYVDFQNQPVDNPAVFAVLLLGRLVNQPVGTRRILCANMLVVAVVLQLPKVHV